MAAQDSPMALKVGEAIQREIHEGEVHEFNLTLQSAYFARGTLEPTGVAVVLIGQLPDGTKTRDFSVRDGRVGKFSIAGEMPGTYRVKITATKGTGRYRLILEVLQSFSDRLAHPPVSEHNASPRLTKLRKAIADGDADATARFWEEIKQQGAPLYEPSQPHPGQTLVTFLWRATYETHDVLVVWSPFSSQHPDDYAMQHIPNSDVWYKTFIVPDGARIQHQLSPNDGVSKADDNSDQRATAQMDPLNPNRRPDDPTYSKFRVFSVANLPGAPAQPWADVRPGVPTGRIEKIRIKSEFLKNERSISVYLPPHYDPAGPANHLVILFDDSTHITSVPVPTTLDNLLSEGRIPPTVAALIDSRAVALAGIPVDYRKIVVRDLGCPHEPTTLPAGKMAVYCFRYRDEVLKIGKVGPNSSARFHAQHYLPGSSNSNLAKSLLADRQGPCRRIDKARIGVWMKRRLHRTDILIDSSVDIRVLGFLEAFLHCYYSPKYEGFASQRQRPNQPPATVFKKQE